jgi:hypothetical protein
MNPDQDAAPATSTDRRGASVNAERRGIPAASAERRGAFVDAERRGDADPGGAL